MFLVYDKATGDIGHSIGGPEQESYGNLLDEQGMTWLFVPDFNGEIWNHYVVDGAVRLRPHFSIMQTGSHFDGIPAGCEAAVFIENECVARDTITDGMLSLDAPAGHYSVRFSISPFRPASFDVVIE